MMCASLPSQNTMAAAAAAAGPRRQGGTCRRRRRQSSGGRRQRVCWGVVAGGRACQATQFTPGRLSRRPHQGGGSASCKRGGSWAGRWSRGRTVGCPGDCPRCPGRLWPDDGWTQAAVRAQREARREGARLGAAVSFLLPCSAAWLLVCCMEPWEPLDRLGPPRAAISRSTGWVHTKSSSPRPSRRCSRDQVAPRTIRVLPSACRQQSEP